MCLGQIELFQRHNGLAAVEYTQHHVFPVNGGLGGDAKVDGVPGNFQRDMAVLWRAGFRDIHVGQDFQSHHDRRPVFLVQAAHLAQHPVDAIAYSQKAFLRFEVYI